MVLEATLWLIRGFAAVIIAVTALPLIRSGAWFIRMWDFPRLQIAAIGAAALAVLIAIENLHGWSAVSVVSVSALALAMFWQGLHVVRYTRLWPHHSPNADGNDALSIIIANLDVRNDTKRDAAQAIRSVNPDIALLIEVDDTWMAALTTVRDEYEYRVEAVAPDGLGIVLWSKSPIGSSEVRHLVSEDRPSIHATIDTESIGRVRFIGLHPTPPGLKKQDENERYDSRIRDAELVRVARSVADQPDQTQIVAGDFNDVAWSHTTRLFERISGLHDPRVGRRLLNTYDANHPFLRYPLDHVYLSPNCAVRDVKRLSIPGSDHFAVVVGVEVQGRQSNASARTAADREEEAALIAEGLEDAEHHNEAAR